jgi:hypothetical protein
MAAADDLTPRERGLILGHSYAASFDGDPRKLTLIAKAKSAADVEANVDAALLRPGEIEDDVAFWSGFSHGVKAFLVEQGTPLDSPSPT